MQRTVWAGLTEDHSQEHGQSQCYKSISRDLDFPLFTMHNVVKKLKAQCTVANLPARAQEKSWPKIAVRDCLNCGERTSDICKTDSSWPSDPRYQHFNSHHPSPTQCRPSWSLPKHSLTSQNSSWRMSSGKMRPNKSFLVNRINSCLQEN